MIKKALVVLLGFIPSIAPASNTPDGESILVPVVESIYFPAYWDEMKVGYKPRITDVAQHTVRVDGFALAIECIVTGDWVQMLPGEGVWIDANGAPVEFEYQSTMVTIDQVIMLIKPDDCEFKGSSMGDFEK